MEILGKKIFLSSLFSKPPTQGETRYDVVTAE